MIGLYIHIPFCDKKCPYCDFYSLGGSSNLFDDYAQALLRAVEKAPASRVDTVYFGGGTPSIWGTERLCAVLDAVSKRFDVLEHAEITLEGNPGSLNEPMLQRLREKGFNRISIGIQSTFDDTLRVLGRRHSAKEAIESVHNAHRAGFRHISADLMLAVPGQTIEQAKADIDRLASLPVDHLSVYLLKHEQGTDFFAQKPASDDLTADIYLAAVERCEKHGLQQYEISNFALSPAAQSRHNKKYWLCQPTLGIGPSAHSFVDGSRFYFPRDLSGFICASNPWSMVVSDGMGGDDEERIMLGLRLKEGIAPNDYPAYSNHITGRAAILEKNGLVKTGGGRIWLTSRGYLLSNSVIADLLDVKPERTAER
jgi:oxygen-independent coproporphyrinogen-3 oxidase